MGVSSKHLTFHQSVTDFSTQLIAVVRKPRRSTTASQGRVDKAELRSKEETRQIWIHSQLWRVSLAVLSMHLVIPNSSIAS
jgi:hypothetical protein